MGYNARAIANYFLDLAERDGVALSPLKLQKLVFIAHGWHLALSEQPLIDDEYAEAWQYGPVFPSVYHAFKRFGSGAIKERATRTEFRDPFEIVETIPRIPEDDIQTRHLLDKIWQVYGRFSGLQLSDMTHSANTPWELTRKNTGEVRNADIPNDVIQTHYRQMADENRRRREQKG